MALGAMVVMMVSCTIEDARDVDDDDGGGSGASSSSSMQGSGGSTSSNGGSTSSSQSSTVAGMCDGGPLSAPVAGCTPTPLPKTGDFGQDCVDRINQFRWECQCLPPLARWTEEEMCTDSQSSADQNGGGAHGNFGMCGENAQNTCPDWNSEDHVIDGCLQMMWDEGPGENYQAHGHYLAMSSTSYSKVACGRSSGSSGVWSNQNFAQ